MPGDLSPVDLAYVEAALERGRTEGYAEVYVPTDTVAALLASAEREARLTEALREIRDRVKKCEQQGWAFPTSTLSGIWTIADHFTPDPKGTHQPFAPESAEDIYPICQECGLPWPCPDFPDPKGEQ